MNEQTALTPYTSAPPEQTIIETQVIVSPEPAQKQRPSLPLLITAWTESKKSKRTREEYLRTINDFQQFLSTYTDENGHPVHILESFWQDIELAARAFVPLRKDSQREAQGVSPFYLPDPSRALTVSTKNRRVAALRSFYEYLVDHDHLTKNPLKLIEAEKGDRPRKAHAIAPHVVKAGVQSIDTSTLAGKRDKALLAILLTTGQRVSEVTGLTWERVFIDHEGKMIARFLCKGGKVLEPALDESTRQALEVYRSALVVHLQDRKQAFTPDLPVFINLSRHHSKKRSEREHTHPLMLTTEAVSLITEKYLNESRVHATRHTRAVRAVKNGATYLQIMQDYGHSSLQVTTTYLDDLIKDERQYINSLAQEFGI